MGSPYSSTSVSGYNNNPPPDDGTTVATNKITWAGIKTKLGDPLNTFASAVNTALVNAWAKTVDGGTLVTTAVDYPMTSADQGRVIKVTVSGKTVTTPDAGTVLAPFVFVVINQSTGTITIAGNATNSQTVDGQTTQVIKSGSGCFLFTDGTGWFTSGLKAAQLTSANPPYGFDEPVNLQLNASVGSSLLTVAVKTNSGADPTASDPVLIPFRDSTVANGGPVWVAVTSALSINTNGVGATLGSASNTAFRFWVVAFNNSGTVVLALINCLTPTAGALQVWPLNDRILQSSTAISAAATSAGVFYTPNGTTVSSKSICVLGFIEYNSTGLATAGTYASAPTWVQLAGPNTPRPGTPVQHLTASTSTSGTTNSGTFANLSSGQSSSITLTSTANIVEVTSIGMCSGTATANASGLQIVRGSTVIGNTYPFNIVTASVSQFVSMLGYEMPNTTGSLTYNYQGKTSGGATISYPTTGSASGVVLSIKEIMA